MAEQRTTYDLSARSGGLPLLARAYLERVRTQGVTQLTAHARQYSNESGYGAVAHAAARMLQQSTRSFGERRRL